MIDPSDLSIFGIPLAFLSTALLIELTPGPNMTYLAVLTLGEGRRAGLAAVAGVGIGLLIAGVLAAALCTAPLGWRPVSFLARL
jgi:threonine/homoserine/homoserine lactone efflux protein